MNNNTVYIGKTKGIYERLVHIQIFFLVSFAIYHGICFCINPNHQLTYYEFFFCITIVTVSTMTEEGVRKLQFDNEKEELIITRKAPFGNEKFTCIKYSELNYRIKNLNAFWSFFYWKKELILCSKGIMPIRLKSKMEFNMEEIEKIEKALIQIKMPAGNSRFSQLRIL